MMKNKYWVLFDGNFEKWDMLEDVLIRIASLAADGHRLGNIENFGELTQGDDDVYLFEGKLVPLALECKVLTEE